MKKPDRWLKKDGLVMIAGWRRWGADLKEVAKNMGVTMAQLERWADEFDEIRGALEKNGDVEDFLVEETVLQKALDGDQKAIEFWLKYRGRDNLAKNQDAKAQDGVDYVMLADLIR
ncbi:MAG: hypothetical protein FWB74_08360 [Defluviitaleaceae bacterium]|nr:hypothetical protein [Defluviitaleaceae bacterium]